ncbi:MAG: Unknown protein [uncultured Sulfurovum sp.]|uniref:DUF5644 domain-containing protein n=1 Tax=uncultured Sulfurovum sp. TaxID=269237 RepID=A0A6S6SBQ6_9BACT|nr:MAG: Unknown protein [uncultured Sulfurovum sp.]
MSHTLNVRAFFFNAKTDYLPYYKNFTLSLDNDAKAKDIVVAIKEQNSDFSYPTLNLIFKINSLMVEAEQSVSSIVEKFGNTLTIEPAKIYRSNNGLIINDDDFMQSFELLAPYATDDDKAYYKTLYALHYASETENFEHQYIGDAVLILAHKMIEDGNEHKDAILEAISTADSGLLDCEYENNLFNTQDHTQTIETLKAMYKNDDNEHPSLLDMIKTRLGIDKKETQTDSTPKRKTTIIDNLEDKRIAHYSGLNSHEEMHKHMTQSNITEIHFPRSHKLSGLSVIKDNKDLAFKKAGTTLLSAFDAGAEVVVVEEVEVLDMFTKHFSAIEKTIGRKMIGLELISSEDFIEQTS